MFSDGTQQATTARARGRGPRLTSSTDEDGRPATVTARWIDRATPAASRRGRSRSWTLNRYALSDANTQVSQWKAGPAIKNDEKVSSVYHTDAWGLWMWVECLPRRGSSPCVHPVCIRVRSNVGRTRRGLFQGTVARNARVNMVCPLHRRPSREQLLIFWVSGQALLHRDEGESSWRDRWAEKRPCAQSRCDTNVVELTFACC